MFFFPRIVRFLFRKFWLGFEFFPPFLLKVNKPIKLSYFTQLILTKIWTTFFFYFSRYHGAVILIIAWTRFLPFPFYGISIKIYREFQTSAPVKQWKFAILEIQLSYSKALNNKFPGINVERYFPYCFIVVEIWWYGLSRWNSCNEKVQRVFLLNVVYCTHLTNCFDS